MDVCDLFPASRPSAPGSGRTSASSAGRSSGVAVVDALSDRLGLDRPPHPTSADYTEAPQDHLAEMALGRVNWAGTPTARRTTRDPTDGLG